MPLIYYQILHSVIIKQIIVYFSVTVLSFYFCECGKLRECMPVRLTKSQERLNSVQALFFHAFCVKTQCYKTHKSKLKMASKNAFGSLRGKETIFITSRVFGFKTMYYKSIGLLIPLEAQGFSQSLAKHPCRFTCLLYASFILFMSLTLRKGFDPFRSQLHNPSHSKQ